MMNNHKKDLGKKTLYESVKSVIEAETPHIHLDQHKLYTLASIAFQYLLFSSTKKPGYYLVRVEDSHLAEKLTKKSKDDVTRKFLNKLLLPRRLKYGNSTFLLDYFQSGSWVPLNDFPPEKLKGALIIRNTTRKPLDGDEDSAEDENTFEKENLSNHLYYNTLQKAFEETIVVAYGLNFPGTKSVRFPFIKEEDTEALSGVKISESSLNYIKNPES